MPFKLKMEYKTNSALIDKIYNEFKDDFEQDGLVISKNPEELDIEAIPDCYLFERYKNQPKDMDSVDSIVRHIQSGQPMAPVLVDKNNNLIDGFHRILACKQLGMNKVICLRFSGSFSHQEMK